MLCNPLSFPQTPSQIPFMSHSSSQRVRAVIGVRYLTARVNINDNSIVLNGNFWVTGIAKMQLVTDVWWEGRRK
jgi:hypothetical protein